MCEVIKLLCRGLPSQAYIFGGLRLSIVDSLFREALQNLGWPIVPHGMRHAGPSHDSYVQGSALLDIQARGRWFCAESVRTYAKPARLLRSVARLSIGQVQHSRRVSAQLHTTLTTALKAVF